VSQWFNSVANPFAGYSVLSDIVSMIMMGIRMNGPEGTPRAFVLHSLFIIILLPAPVTSL